MGNIHIFSRSFSEGVMAERVALKSYAEEHSKILSDCATLTEYVSKSNAPSEYLKFTQMLPSAPMKILDIGVGRGESSLFLSSLGHHVFAVEPSEDFCQLIEAAAEKYGMSITVCQGVAEDLDRLGETMFDVIFFNSSLHHCDIPMAALHHSYGLLRPGGHICLASELHIKPWVSKAWWNKRLETHPIEMGHYGGNEHAYYSWEYRRMLIKSGFICLQIFPMQSYFSPLDRLANILDQRINGERIFGEMDFLIRAVIYVIAARVLRRPLLFLMLTRMSLIMGNYLARKPL